MKTIVIACICLLSVVAVPAAAQDLSGHWQGCWSSQCSGHQGRISASFCQINDCQVKAQFKGTFARIIPFRYNATLQIVHQEPGLMVVSGSRKLGPLGGTFSYQATITEGQFSATYSSGRDRGTWNLSRTGY